MSLVPGRSSETVSTDVDKGSDFTFSLENDPVVTTSEKKSDTPDSVVDSSNVRSNQLLSYKDLQRRLGEKLLEETMESELKLEAEVEKLRKHLFKLSEKCENLENMMFTLNNFVPDEVIAFYRVFSWQHSIT